MSLAEHKNRLSSSRAVYNEVLSWVLGNSTRLAGPGYRTLILLGLHHLQWKEGDKSQKCLLFSAFVSLRVLFLSLYTGLHCILHQRVQVCFYISSLLRVLPGETRLNSDKLYATKFPFFPPCFINKSQKYPSLKFLSHANTGLIFAIFTQTKFSRTEEGLENPADIYINIKVFLPSAIDKALEYHRTCFLSNIPHHLNLVPWP